MDNNWGSIILNMSTSVDIISPKFPAELCLSKIVPDLFAQKFSPTSDLFSRFA